MAIPIIGIDLGFASSPTSVCVIDHYSIDRFYKIRDIYKLGPFLSYHTNKRNPHLGRFIVVEAVDFIIKNTKPNKLVIEEPFLQGNANKDFNKFLGMLENKIINDYNIIYISPLSVKKHFGSGKLEKNELAEKLLTKFEDKSDIKLIKKAIETQDFDVTDSIAIALAGYEANNNG